MNIFVGSISFKMDETELREHFEEYGEVTSARIITDKFTGRSRGFGFVEMSDDAAAQKAIDELDGTEMAGRTVVVNKSEDKPRPKRDFGGGGGSGGGGGYGGGGGNRDRGGDRGGDRDRY